MILRDPMSWLTNMQLSLSRGFSWLTSLVYHMSEAVLFNVSVDHGRSLVAWRSSQRTVTIYSQRAKPQ